VARRPVVRVDPARLTIASTLAVGIPASTSDRTLAVSPNGSTLYVGWSTPRQMYGVSAFDAKTGRALAQNPRIGGGPVVSGPTLQLDGARLWVSFPTGNLGQADALRSTNLRPTGESVGGPNNLSIIPEGDRIWVSRATRIDCTTTHNKVLASYPSPSSGGGLVAQTPTASYVET